MWVDLGLCGWPWILGPQGSHVLVITGVDTLFELTGSGASEVKASAWNAGDPGSIPGSGRSPGEGNPTPVLLPGESHRGRSLVGYSPWDRKESDKTSLSLSVLYWDGLET